MLFFVDVAVTIYANFQAGDAIFCPLVDCVLPVLCQDQPLHDSFLTIGDRICPMCQTCALPDLLGGVGKRAVPCSGLQCPLPDCPGGTIVPTHQSINGHVCSGCPACDFEIQTVNPLDVLLSSLKQYPGVHLPLAMACPIMECAKPGPCPGGYHYHSFVTLDGQNCTGCPYCLSTSLLGF